MFSTKNKKRKMEFPEKDENIINKNGLEFLLQQTKFYADSISQHKLGKSFNKKDNWFSNKSTVIYDRTPPYIRNGEMKCYQIEGLNWLISLYENSLNGILADEMGLVKTLQTISMLGYLKNVKKINGPFLIIVPKSTISNWMNEIRRWCPSLRAFAFIGNKEERNYIIQNNLRQKKNWDICVTTNEICFRSKFYISQIMWHYLTVDEAHRLKNEGSLISRTLRTFKLSNKLLLTGTPLQNNLHELWSLLNFILPNIFNSSDDFDEWFDSIECLTNEEPVEKLQTVLKPFMLQRLKQEVEKTLPSKKEVKIYVELTELQRTWYKKILLKDINVINGAGIESKMRFNFLLVHLMKCASHPYILPGAEPEPLLNGEHLINNSGKMIVLDKLLNKLKEQKSRVVIFCQLMKLLDILEDYCHMRGFKYFRLDGYTSYENRANDIAQFNISDSDVFLYLISTTAGGLGINLQSADVVILLQSHWNPQVDSQAIDRVHRIGQKKPVRVFRFISQDTVEEKLIKIAQRKIKLNKKVLLDQKKSLKYDNNEMKEIINFGIQNILSSNKFNNTSKVKDEDIAAILDCFNNGCLVDSFRMETNTNIQQSQQNLNLAQKLNINNNIHKMEKENDQNNNNTQSVESNKQKYHNDENDSCVFHDFQFFPEVLYNEANRLKYETNNIKLYELIDQGFPDWNKLDFNQFIEGSKMFGKNNIKKISTIVDSKSIAEIRKYHKVFWKRYKELKDLSFLNEIK